LVTGDFDAGISDIDLLAVLADAPSERLAAHLGRMHADLAQANPAWGDRIEVIYISAHGLARCRTATTTIAVLSPSEPFHVLDGVGAAGPPQSADLIGRALGWRQRQRDPGGQDGAATVPETRRFVTEMAKLALER
jgi:hypothetical protein